MAAVQLSVVLPVAMVMLAMVGSSEAYDFLVGGRDGWVKHPAESYGHWAERNRFQVHDKLVFKFNPREDSVLVVNEQDFDSCSTSKPVQRLDGGDAAFQLDHSGRFFFVSGAPGRCRAGQKLVVEVLAARPPPPSPAPSPPPSAVAPSPKVSPPKPSPAPAPAPSSASPVVVGASLAAALAMALTVFAGAYRL